MTELKKIAIGVSDFKTLIENNYYFVDKTLLIQDILEEPSLVLLIPRPRRFGKTLNLSMLQTFLEKSDRNYADLFKKLAISQNKKAMSHQGQYPVISLTFKDAKQIAMKNVWSILNESLSGSMDG